MNDRTAIQIAEELRDAAGGDELGELLLNAADEIERLERENAELHEVLSAVGHAQTHPSERAADETDAHRSVVLAELRKWAALRRSPFVTWEQTCEQDKLLLRLIDAGAADEPKACPKCGAGPRTWDSCWKCGFFPGPPVETGVLRSDVIGDMSILQQCEAMTARVYELESQVERLRAPKEIIVKGDKYVITPCDDGTVDIAWLGVADEPKAVYCKCAFTDPDGTLCSEDAKRAENGSGCKHRVRL